MLHNVTARNFPWFADTGMDVVRSFDRDENLGLCFLIAWLPAYSQFEVGMKLG